MSAGLDSTTLIEWLRAARAKGVRMDVSPGRNPGEIAIRNVNGEVGETTLSEYTDAIRELLYQPGQYSGKCIDSLMSTVEQMEKKAS